MEEQYPRAWHYHSAPVHGIQAHRPPAGRKEGTEWNAPNKERPRLWSPHFKGGSQTTGPRARGKRVQGDCGGKALGSTIQGQEQVWAGGRQPSPTGSQPLAMGRLHRCRSPLPAGRCGSPELLPPRSLSRLLLIKPLSICRRLHGSGRAHRSALGSTALINPCSAGAAAPAAGDGSCRRGCRHPVGPRHSHSTSRGCNRQSTLGTATKAQTHAKAARSWPQVTFPQHAGEAAPTAVLRAARGTLPAPQPNPAQAPSPVFTCPAASWLVWPLGLGRLTAHPAPRSSIPCRGTYMAHCSFSFLMEPYSACREKSGRSAGERCQPGGLLWRTEEACQTGSGTPEAKVTPCQFVPVQPGPG